MSRDAFIGELRHRMAGLPQEAVDRTVEYYSELIADSMEDGVAEEEAVSRLGSLDEIVANVVKETPLTQIVQTRVQEGKKKGISGWVILLLVLGRRCGCRCSSRCWRCCSPCSSPCGRW